MVTVGETRLNGKANEPQQDAQGTRQKLPREIKQRNSARVDKKKETSGVSCIEFNVGPPDLQPSHIQYFNV